MEEDAPVAGHTQREAHPEKDAAVGGRRGRGAGLERHALSLAEHQHLDEVARVLACHRRACAVRHAQAGPCGGTSGGGKPGTVHTGQDVVEGDALAVAEGYGAVVADGVAVDLEDHVVLLEELRGVGQRPDLADQHPGLRGLHAEELAHLQVLHRLAADSERGKPLVRPPVPPDVLEEVLDDRHRDDEPDVLRAVERLERDPNHLVVHDRRAPAVARVDGRVDLNREERRGTVHVLLGLHARDDADRHGDVVPTRRIPHDGDRILQLGDAAARAARAAQGVSRRRGFGAGRGSRARSRRAPAAAGAARRQGGGAAGHGTCALSPRGA